MNDFAVPIFALLFIGLVSIIMVFTSDQVIVTDEAFKVASDTSKYSCIVSEVESELSLNCLKVK